MLIHDFDIFRWILDDEAATVYATGSCLTDPAIEAAGDIDSTAVTIRTRRGRLAQINTSRRAAYGYDQRFEVLGSKGMLQAGNHRPTEVAAHTAASVSHDKPEHFFLERYRVAYANEMAHFFDAVAGGKPVRTTIARRRQGAGAGRRGDARRGANAGSSSYDAHRGAIANERRLRIGIAGLGRLGRRHAENLAQRVPRARADRRLQPGRGRARLGRASSSASRAATRDYAAMLADPDVDAVFLVTPTLAACGADHRRRCRRASTCSAKSRCRWSSPTARACSGKRRSIRELKVMIGYGRRFDPSYRDALRQDPGGRDRPRRSWCARRTST